MVTICEPKLDGCRINEFRIMFGFDNYLSNVEGLLWLFLQHMFSCSIINKNIQQMTIKVMCCSVPDPCIMPFVRDFFWGKEQL